MFKKLWLFLITGFIALALVGCGEAEVSTVGDSSDSTAEKKEGNKEEETPEFYKPDETVSIDGVEISIDSVSWGKEAEYSESQNGKIMRLEVTIKNNSEDNAFADNTEFALSDAEGNMMDSYYGNDDANMFSSEIKKGKQVKGILEYDVPESESYELYYEPSFSFKENTEVKWLIEKSDVQ
ncbi:lipoprotein [Bacillus freudenreichii]|nr:lipoprotein [Bacillus freudenreichii]